MPSRTMTLAIAVFWLATVGWMFYRDRARDENQPPPFQFSLTDEVGPPSSGQWDVIFRDRQVAVCNTTLGREPRRFRLKGVYVFEHSGWDFGKIPIGLIETSYHFTLRGELVEVKARVSKQVDGRNPRFHAEVQANSWGTVHARKPESPGEEKPQLARLASLEAVFNPLLPRFTLPGLFVGKTWEVTVLDPLENARKRPEAGSGVLTASGQARVSKVDFSWTETAISQLEKRTVWQGGKKKEEWALKMVPGPGEPREYSCWRVDIEDAAGALRSRIWVRQSDELVLQQEVNYPEGTLKLVRKLDKKR